MNEPKFLTATHAVELGFTAGLDCNASAHCPADVRQTAFFYFNSRGISHSCANHLDVSARKGTTRISGAW